jgi:ubiquinone/menaquinone biosynthesis C-methylase UbiE
MRLSICVLALFYVLAGYAQRDSSMLQIISGLDRYRTDLLSSRIADRALLGRVIKKQRELGIPTEYMSELFVTLAHVPGTYVGSDSAIGALLKLWLVSRPIIRNRDMYDLMHENILDVEYPYILSPNTAVYKELKFYDIQNGERIAEIGAGNGEFAVLLGVIYQDLEIYVNEIEEHYTSYISQKLSRVRSIHPQNTYHVVLGTKEDPNLPKAYFDKVIVRRTLHHFSNFDAMLESIAALLAPGGELLVFEDLKNDSPGNCAKSMTDQEILRKTQKHYFVLAGRWQKGFEAGYRFRKKRAT